MKRHFSFLFTILLFCLPSLIHAQAGVVTTVEQQLWMRSGPGLEWRKIEVMPIGMTVALDGRSGNGVWVRGINSNGTVGWMAGRFLTLNSEGIFALPIINYDAPITVGAPAPGAVVAPPANNPPADTGGGGAPAPVIVSGGLSTTATANVNMRSGPSTEYRRVGGVLFNQPITLDGRDGTVGWVRGVNGDGTVGWVSTRYIGLTYNEIATLPVVDVNSPFGLAVPSSPAPQVVDVPTGAPVAPVANTTPISGFGLGGQVQGFSDFAANWMRVAGMTWVKRQVVYHQGNDPNGWAGMINDAHARGFRILLSVIGHPSELNNPGYFDQYASFVGGLAALGGDAIEVWNEMNIDREWPAGQINPAMYVQLLAPSFNAIKANNPNTLVISGAPAPTGFFGGCHGGGCDDAPYMQGMAAAGAANYMDCIGIHYNEGIIPPTQNSGDPRGGHYTRYYSGMVNAYWNAFGGSRPLCFTEIGYLSPEGYGPLPGNFAWAGGTSVAQQAAWIDQAMNLAASSGRVRIFIVWNVDFSGYGADPQGGYGIIRPDGSCPACNALGS